MADVIPTIEREDEETMLPNPSPDQTNLWSRIESSLSERSIKTKSNFQKLSDDIRIYTASQKTADKISEISKKYNVREKALLTKIIAWTILGEIHIKDFIGTISKNCRMNQDFSRRLGSEINREIFLPIKQHMKEKHGLDKWPGEETKKEPEIKGNVINLRR